jgi:hypothetical protein
MGVAGKMRSVKAVTGEPLSTFCEMPAIGDPLADQSNFMFSELSLFGRGMTQIGDALADNSADVFSFAYESSFDSTACESASCSAL